MGEGRGQTSSAQLGDAVTSRRRLAHAGDVRVDRVEDESGLAELAEEWDALADEHSNPFVRHAWFSSWWQAFGDGRPLRVYVARRGGRLTAALPLYARGRGLHALANEQTPLFSALGGGAALRAVVDAAVAAGHALELPVVAAHDPLVAAVEDSARRHGAACFREPHLVSPIALLEGTYDDYVRSISKKVSSGVARRRRKLEAEHGLALTLVEPPEDVDAALSAGFAVESRSWKRRRGTAIASIPSTERFYREVGRAFAGDGQLWISQLQVGARPIAFSYCLLDHNRLWGLKFGYDEEYARYGPGILLVVATIERCYELGIDALEMLGDAEPWKRRFAKSTRELVNLRLYHRRPVPLTRYAYRRAVRPAARTVYRRVLAPRLSGRSWSRSR